MRSEKPIVKVYSTTTCPYCTMAKNFLRENGVEFIDKNVGNDAAAANEMMEKSGQMGVPVIDINGEIIIGFNRDAITKALNLK